MTVVSAPASSANLGPGFDVLGLALDLRVRASDTDPVRVASHRCGPDHIARLAYERAGGTGPIWFDFDVPPGRGLGFSAAARAAGATLAFLQAGAGAAEAQDRAYEVVLELEGHGDNAAPATFGGIHVIAGDRHHRVDAEFPADLVLWVPNDTSTSTDASRAAMGDAVSRDDAVFNLGRVALLLAAIYESRPELLAAATEDRIHQPGRLEAAPGSHAAMSAGREAGAVAAWLSGSGPTIAFAVDDGCRSNVIEAMPAAGTVFELGIDLSGARAET